MHFLFRCFSTSAWSYHCRSAALSFVFMASLNFSSGLLLCSRRSQVLFRSFVRSCHCCVVPIGSFRVFLCSTSLSPLSSSSLSCLFSVFSSMPQVRAALLLLHFGARFLPCMRMIDGSCNGSLICVHQSIHALSSRLLSSLIERDSA